MHCVACDALLSDAEMLESAEAKWTEDLCKVCRESIRPDIPVINLPDDDGELSDDGCDEVLSDH